MGRAQERNAIRVFRLSRIRGKVGYATKAEHDFQRPTDFDPRGYANRIQWQFGDPLGTAEIWIGERIAWQIERHFGRYGEMGPPGADGGRVYRTAYSDARQLVAWVLGLGENARIVDPPALTEQLRECAEVLVRSHTGEPEISAAPAARRGPAHGHRRARARVQQRPPRPTRRSGPSASPDWSRWPASSSRPAEPGGA